MVKNTRSLIAFMCMILLLLLGLVYQNCTQAFHLIGTTPGRSGKIDFNSELEQGQLQEKELNQTVGSQVGIPENIRDKSRHGAYQIQSAPKSYLSNSENNVLVQQTILLNNEKDSRNISSVIDEKTKRVEKEYYAEDDPESSVRNGGKVESKEFSSKKPESQKRKKANKGIGKSH